MVAGAEQVVILYDSRGEQQNTALGTVVYNGRVISLKVTTSTVVALTYHGELLAFDWTSSQFISLECGKGIKCVELGSKNDQLLIVRQLESNRTVLEVIETIDNWQVVQTLKRYELALDCADFETQFCVKNIHVRPENCRFLSDFLGFTQLTCGQIVVLIGANSNLYWLRERQDDVESDLIIVRTFASNVLDFNLSDATICLAVLLEGGVMTVFSRSSLPETLLICSTSIYLLSPPVVVHTFAHGLLLYSNGSETYRVRYEYSKEAKQVVTKCEKMPVCGVVAITLLEHIRKAVFLTENNLFYIVDCMSEKSIPTADPTRMMKLRKTMPNVSKRITRRLTDEVELDERLVQAIAKEQMKYDALALYRNRQVFGKLANMDISFHREMPSRYHGALLETEGKSEPITLFASVKITLNLGYFELLVKQKRWCLNVEFNRRTMVWPVHETFNKEGHFHTIVPLTKSQLVSGLPTFRAEIFTSVEHGHDGVLLTLLPVPTTVQSEEHSTKEFIVNLSPASYRKSVLQNRQTAVAEEIIRKNSGDRSANRITDIHFLTYCIRNEQSKARALRLSGDMRLYSHHTWSVLDEPVTVGWNAGKTAIQLSANHPLALDQFKRYLLPPDEYDVEISCWKDNLKIFYLELQAASENELIVQLYRRLRNSDSNLEILE
ncbi:uncharacterized protein LOC128270691 [Anopheles cruzii]|uniref:uncharacterized protein LOC128270691 n=1 Tax=Anopheles cruzii TaxID=68878 RepID=UPI0022EC6A66|nr:uncharacterized protein LOC128270691 [Anopheles cruzii]